jgi:hypothetical protein
MVISFQSTGGGENDFTAEKPDRHHLSQVIKIKGNSKSHLEIMDP